MIISRTPFRISFFGGGTDFPYWYNENTGKVLSTTFDKYCYVNIRNLPPFFKYNYKLRYFKTEEVKNINQIVHPSIREILKFKKIKKKLEIVHQADLPAQSGLGASSSFSVGLIHCIAALDGQMISKRNLADQSLHVEQNILKEYVGSQDQIASAFGGFNVINFKKNFYEVNSVTNAENIKKIEKNIVLVFSGTAREAQVLEKEKKRNFNKNINYLKKINEITFKAEEKISNSKNIMSDFSELMDEYWWLKKKLASSVTNSHIDEIFKLAKNSGAESGKLLGAGGGGFFLFVVKEKKQKEFFEKLKKLVILSPRFESLGSQIIYYQK